MSDGVEVKLGADASGLKSTFDGAASVARDKLSQIGKYLQGIAADGKSSEKELAGVFEKIKGAFGETANSAETSASKVVGSFSLMKVGIAAALSVVAATVTAAFAGIRDLQEEQRSVDLLRYTFGMTGDQASLLNVKLQLLGKTSEEYAMIGLNLARQIRIDEQRMRDLGVATRDAAGNFLPMEQVMQNAFSTMQTYKAGLDQNQFALEAFGRSAKDVFAYMSEGEAAQKRAVELQKEYGIEMSAEKRDSIRAYTMEQRALNIIWGEMRQQLGEQLLPIMKNLTAWFAQIGPGAVQVMSAVLSGIITVLTAVGAAFSTLVVTMGAWADNVINKFTMVGQVIKAVFTGDFAAIPGIVAASRARTVANEKAMADTIKDTWSNAYKTIKQQWSTPPAGSGGALGGPPGGGRTYVAKAKGGAAAADKSMMGGYEAELAAQRDAYERMKLEQGSFERWSEQQTSTYWKTILDTMKDGDRDRDAVSKKYYAAERVVRQQAFDSGIAMLESEKNSIKFNFDERVRLAQEAYRRIAAAYGATSTQAIAAEQRVNQEIERGQQLQIRYAEIDRRAADARANHELQMAQMTVAQKVALGEMSVQQALAAEATLQTNLYQLRVQGLRDELALLDERDPRAREINAKIEQAEMEHQAQMTEIANKAVLDRKQYEIQAMQGIQSDLKSFLADLGHSGKTIKQQFMDLFGSIDQRIRKMIADKLIDQLFGGGTQGGGLLAKFLGMLGGSMMGGGTPGIAGGSIDLAGGGPPAFASGTPYVSNTGLAVIHKGEAIIPAAQNRGGSRGGVSVVNNFHITGEMNSKTQSQIAAHAARGLHRANMRDN
jgi:hypothetical protein